MSVPLHLHVANVSHGKLRPVREPKPRRSQLTPHIWLSGQTLITALGIVFIGGIFLGALLVRLGEHVP
jgi:hypothetical protein